jgi:hypothetical protein
MDMATNSVLIQLGSLGILGIGLVWVAKWLVPRAIAIVEKLIEKHEAAMKQMGEDHKAVVKEVCKAFAVETDKCHEERISDRAERVAGDGENRKVLADVASATNRQTAVLGTIASRMKIDGP